MAIPTFIDVNEVDQCTGLREYLMQKGAKIGASNSQKGWNFDLEDIISGVEVIFTGDSVQDIESVLNSIVSLLIAIPPSEQACQRLIINFCNKLVAAPRPLGPVSLRVLSNLYEGIGENKTLRYDVFLAMVKIAGSLGQIRLVVSNINQVKQWAIGIETEKFQDLFRQLHEVLLSNRESELASQVMVELLASYTEETASQARNDAQRCIVSSLADPNTFLLDHLLTLTPVKILEGELIHGLLTIFVNEKLPNYLTFYAQHKSFVDGLGLNHDQCVRKIRLLTFMQMAETQKEITFDKIRTELQIKDESVEPFVIEVLKTRLVKAKIDQMNRKVYVTSTMHRTFGRSQWIQLKETLVQWQQNLDKVRMSIGQFLPREAPTQVSRVK